MALSDFMISFAGDGISDWREYIQTADASGFWGLGIADSQSIYPDVYVCCTIAAMTTRNVHLGPWVTNPLTRHPAVTAGAIASVDQLSGGRTFLGIGTGHSATANISLRPSSLAYLESYLEAVKDLLTHGEAQWEGQTLKLSIGQRRVPVACHIGILPGGQQLRGCFDLHQAVLRQAGRRGLGSPDHERDGRNHDEQAGGNADHGQSQGCRQTTGPWAARQSGGDDVNDDVGQGAQHQHGPNHIGADVHHE